MKRQPIAANNIRYLKECGMNPRAFENLPVLKFEIENMKAQILSYLGAAGSELGEYIAAQIELSVKSYPWEERVKELVHIKIDAAIEYYFKYGPGAQSISRAIDEAFEPILNGGRAKE